MLESNRSDHDLVKKAIQLFSFLGSAQKLKERPAYTTERYESCLWFEAFPTHTAVGINAPTEDSSDEGIIASFRRVPRGIAPELDEDLQEWIEGDRSNPGKRPKVRAAIVKSTATVVGEQLQGDRNEGPWTKSAPDTEPAATPTVALKDHPATQELLDAWLAEWDAWAAQEAKNRPARELYGSIFSTMEQVANHGDEFEAVLGLACLSWTPEGHEAVNRHLLTAHVRFECDDETGEIVIIRDDSQDTLSLEIDMLDARLISNPEIVDEVKLLARDFEGHPLDRKAVGSIARRLLNRLDADAEYDEESLARPKSVAPQAAFAPALVLRKRSQRGIVEIYERIVAHFVETGEVPDGILPLVNPNHRPEPSPDLSPGAVVSIGTDTYLPLPVNERQLQVIQHVNRHAQTLVQGPPGTGKTHTAAALVSHLLAQGKRILITAQTDQALREVRDKLPEDIRPLAVSVIGQSRSDLSDLKVAVERISTNASEHNSNESKKRIVSLEKDIDSYHRQRAGFYSELVAARMVEVSNHEHTHYSGTLASIALEHAAAESTHGWLAAYVRSELAGSSPLSNEAALEWIQLLNDRELLDDEPESRLHLVDLADVPNGEAFDVLAQRESSAAEGSKEYKNLIVHPAFDAVNELSGSVRADLQTRMHHVSGVAKTLEDRHESWMLDALGDVRTGRISIWEARSRSIEQLNSELSPLLAKLGSTLEVEIATGEPAVHRVQAQGLLDYLVAGGKLKTLSDGTPKIGPFSSKALKNSEPFFASVKVNGLPATTPEALELFITWVEADKKIRALDRAWPADVVIPPEDTLSERAQWHQTELEQLLKVLSLGKQIETDAQWLSELKISLPNWEDLNDIRTYAQMVDAVTAHENLSAATEPLKKLALDLETIARLGTATPAVSAMLEAVRMRDVSQYNAAYLRLNRLHNVATLAERRNSLGMHLQQQLPKLFNEVAANASEPTWSSRFAKFSDAWDWVVTGTWILEQDTTDVNVLQAKINQIDSRITRKVENLAAERAWRHAVSSDRIDGRSRAALTQYAQLVQRLGKGTGKYADARRREIRDAMDRCRSSVPVWIMPTYRIAEQLRIEPDMFDVVIVDEASQAGLDATFLQFLAPRIVVIGDDRQVSPTAVGLDQQKLRDLAHQYISDDPYIASWQDPQRSLFDEAKMRFGGLITLTEHRRCVPEIIGFSNRIAYEPDGIRLIPVRQYGADRLEPIKPIHVADGYEQGKINPAEADAIVKQIVACIADPRYAGKSFGVISLLGKDQASYINNLLLDRIGPEEWFSRDLRCGDAPDFQGSERDVMFLSMAKAPMADRKMGVLTQSMYVQRFNVAASRAKDQLWVFHSMQLSELGNTEDMRFQLLDYCYGVVARGRNLDIGVLLESSVSETEHEEPFDSLFEQRVFNRLIDHGLTVVPQFDSNGYRIDLVVVGGKSRLAIECDGDFWHGPEQYESDLARQRDLERCGWTFFRIRESSFYVDQHAVLQKLWSKLDEMGIKASSWTDEAETVAVQATVAVEEEALSGPFDYSPTEIFAADGDNPEVDEDAQEVDGATEVATEDEDNADDHPESETVDPIVVPDDRVTRREPPLPYEVFTGSVTPTSTASQSDLIAGLLQIVELEGPIVGHRLHEVYVSASGGQRVGKEISRAINSALSRAITMRRLVAENPLGDSGLKPKTFRLPSQPTVRFRTVGPRSIDQMPPAELAELLKRLRDDQGLTGEMLLRSALGELGLKRLTPNVLERLTEILNLLDNAAQSVPLPPGESNAPETPTFLAPFRDEADITRLVTARPPFWKAILFAADLYTGLKSIEGSERLSEEPLVEYTADELVQFSNRQVARLMDIYDEFVDLVTRRLQSIVGDSENGTASQIQELAADTALTYGRLLDWRETFGSMQLTPRAARLQELGYIIAETPLAQFRGFFNELIDEIGKRVEARQAGATEQKPLELSMTLLDNAESLNAYFQELKGMVEGSSDDSESPATADEEPLFYSGSNIKGPNRPMPRLETTQQRLDEARRQTNLLRAELDSSRS